MLQSNEEEKMKSKEVIRQLQEVDPSGEVEVCIGNCDIHFLTQIPAYHDGTLQVLERDKDVRYYNITGAKYVRTGNKIVIYPLSIQDAISNSPKDFPVDYSELSESQAQATKKAHDELREWHRKADYEMEKRFFTDWAKKETEKLTVDTEDIESEVNRFFEANVSPDDQLPNGRVLAGHSYASTREVQWSEKFEVVMDDAFLKIRKK
jgi:hypothetical protein